MKQLRYRRKPLFKVLSSTSIKEEEELLESQIKWNRIQKSNSEIGFTFEFAPVAQFFSKDSSYMLYFKVILAEMLTSWYTSYVLYGKTKHTTFTFMTLIELHMHHCFFLLHM